MSEVSEKKSLSILQADELVRMPVVLTREGEDARSFRAALEVLTLFPQEIAAAESRRLTAYMSALAAVLREDMNVSDIQLSHAVDMEALATPRRLSGLFNAVAATTGNVILSDFAIVPERFGSDLFRAFFYKSGSIAGEGYSMGFGMATPRGRESDANVSVPLLFLSDNILKAITPHAPETALRCVQHVMSFGNHDMLHHFSNRVLNSNIAQTQKTYVEEVLEPSILLWHGRSFGGALYQDQDRESYESWLLQMHARVSRRMAAQESFLTQSKDTFLEELSRIHGAIAAEDPDNAAEVVNYLSTVYIFGLMRVYPLTHPLIQETARRAEALAPETFFPLCEVEESALWSYLPQGEKIKAAHVVGAYYQDKNVDLLAMGGVGRRLIGVAELAPEIAFLACQSDDENHNRTARIAVEMMDAAALSSAYGLVDGQHKVVLPRRKAYQFGQEVTIRVKNGCLNNEQDKPAIDVGGSVLIWLRDGVYGRDGGKPHVAYPVRSGEEERYRRLMWMEAGVISKKIDYDHERGFFSLHDYKARSYLTVFVDSPLPADFEGLYDVDVILFQLLSVAPNLRCRVSYENEGEMYHMKVVDGRVLLQEEGGSANFKRKIPGLSSWTPYEIEALPQSIVEMHRRGRDKISAQTAATREPQPSAPGSCRS